MIERACIRAVGAQPYTVERLSGLTLDDLCIRYIKNGIPVIVWATIDMTAPSPGSTWIVRETGRTIQWMTPMHCLLLVGYDDENYYFNDPWRDCKRYAPLCRCNLCIRTLSDTLKRCELYDTIVPLYLFSRISLVRERSQCGLSVFAYIGQK